MPLRDVEPQGELPRERDGSVAPLVPLPLEQQLEAYARDLRAVLTAERRALAELREAYLDTFRRLLSAVSCCDEETGAHLRRMGAYVEVLGRGLGLPEEEVVTMATASALHDIGKIAIPDSILRKRGPLNVVERAIVETHPTIGASILAGSPSPQVQLASEIAANHHENWDGSGYPARLSEERIPLSGRIVRLADQYDALRSERVYKAAFSHEKSLSIILEGDGRTEPSHFEPRILEIFRGLDRDFERIFLGNRDNPNDSEPLSFVPQRQP